MATATKQPKKGKAKATPAGGRGGLAFRVGREALRAAADWAKGAVAARTTKEVLRLVRVEGHADGTLTVRATDLEVSATLTLAADVGTPGVWLFDPDRLCTILANAADEWAAVDCGPGGAELRCDGEYEFEAWEGGETDALGPTAPTGSRVKEFAAGEAADLELALDCVRWATSSDKELKVQAFKGVWVGAGAGGTLTLLASDGRNAAECPVGEVAAPAGLGVVLPPAPLALFLARASGPVTLTVGTTLVAFRDDVCEVVCTQVGGQYPADAIRKALAFDAAGVAEADSGTLFRAVARVMAGAREDERSVHVRPADGSLLVKAGMGKGQAVVPAARVEGDEGVLAVKLDPDRLHRAKRVADVGAVTVEVGKAAGVVRVRAGRAVLGFAQLDR